MADPNPFISRLQHQSPAVDFMDNRLPPHHPMFLDPPTHYDLNSGKYVPNSQALASRPEDNAFVHGEAHPALSPQSPTPLPTSMIANDSSYPSRPSWTDTKAMKFWNAIFPEALEKFKATPEPKGRPKTPYSLRNEHDWDAIYEKLEKARSKYQNEGGKVGWIRKVRRKAADHVAPAAEATKSVGKLVPDNPYSTPVAGAVQVLLDAVNTAATVRGQVLAGFDGLIPIFSDVEVFLGTFPKDASIHKVSVDLTATTLDAIEKAVGFFISNEVLRSLKALGMGTVYESKLRQSLEAINEKSKNLMEEATKSHIFEFNMYSHETRKFAEQMLQQQQELGTQQYKLSTQFTNMMDLFSDNVQERDRQFAIERERHRQIRAAQQEIVFLQIENGRLRSVSPTPQIMSPTPPPQPVPTLEWQVNRQVLRQMLGSVDVDLADAVFALDKKGQLVARERTLAEQIYKSQLFQAWIRPASSAKLLIHWDRKLPRTIANISPLSLLCTSIPELLRAHDRFITAVWLCGLHIDSSESAVGGRWMIASLIDQLLRQHEFDTRSLAADGFNLERIQLGDLNELIRLFEWLVWQLPKTITLVCLIDGVILYEREEMEAFDVLACLMRLAADQDGRTAVKLLFTSTPGTDVVRDPFEEGDLILNVDGLPKLVWAPSEERVAREFGGPEGMQ
ncbi:hypothetical protein B0J13DRAFT_625450 [Dactylonectria estremocensis]|uniref:Uncharacterized protein n=1 Tax=Dactylonectria estremocensis TaxID=1079267 RepID=A0A9P9J098_9HYPO|nr:hypothetical protein B0J13DRAFT_625450 [Dactylonectria estremocensis]